MMRSYALPLLCALALAGCGPGAPPPPPPEHAVVPLLSAGSLETAEDRSTDPPPSVDPPSSLASSPAEECDPNYQPCVPVTSDVDCAGGGGNGPAYVRGEVRVVGTDVYRLDRDRDGTGCDR